MNPRQLSVRKAFDRHAETYDSRFSNAPLGESIRAEVWEIADKVFAGAHRILDLGCGTGEDAIHFARQGMHVTAVDIAPEMLARVQAKVVAAGVKANVECVASEMSQLRLSGERLDGMISNFGAINCTPDLKWLQTLAESGLQPGGQLVLTTMGLFYPLESAVFLIKGNPRKAMRRLTSPCEVSIEGVSIRVYYHSLKSMRRAFGPHFSLRKVVGLRSLLPVPGWEHWNTNWLAPLDRAICHSRWTATLADHFVSVWEYRP